MKIYLTIFGLILFASQALAFDKNHLDNLIFFGSCPGCDLAGADLSGMDLTKADLSGSNLKGANLTDADLSEANFSNADLSKAKIGAASMYNTQFIKTNLWGVNFTEASMPRGCRGDHCDITIFAAYFDYADLRNTNFSRVHIVCSSGMMTNSDFTGAYLIETKLQDCDLSGSNFTNANLTGIKLAGSTLRDVIFCKTKTSVGERNEGCPK